MTGKTQENLALAPAAPTGLPQDFQLAGPMPDMGASGSHLRMQRILEYLLKYWWLVLVTLLLGLGSGVAYVLLSPPIYLSKALMWETIKMRLPEGVMFAEDVQNFLGTQTQLLQSDTLRSLALDRLRTFSNSVAIPLGKDGQPLEVNVRVTQASKSSVFRLECTSSDAAYTRAYLDALMAVYLEYKKNIRKVVSGDTLASITEQVHRAERDLKAEQDALSAFQRTNNLAILQEEGTVAGGYLVRLKTQLSDLELEAKLLETASLDPGRSGGNTTNDVDWVEAVLVTNPNNTQAAPGERQASFRELELLKMQREKLSRYLRPKHPKMIKLDNDIARGEKLIDIFRQQSFAQLATMRQSIQLRILNVQQSIREWESKVIEANIRIAEAERLKVGVQRAQGIYDRLAMLVQNVGISRNIDQETLSILEPASPPTRSYTPEIRALALSGFGGLGLGLGIIILIAVRDDRLTTVAEVNEKVGEFIVGQVPTVPTPAPDAPVPLLQISDQRYAYAESFRNLRSALLYLPVEHERPKVFLITSALPNEGKSTVAANLARTLAMGGLRVVLVDGDLRRGMLHKLMKLQRNPGLADALHEPATLPQAIQVDSIPNFYFIANGSLATHSSDLLMGSALDQVLASLRQQFDYVLIDSSPVFAADDAATLAPKVDGTLFVVRSRFSRAPAVRQALEQLYQRNARVLGVILNQTDPSARSYYYYKYADYYQPPQTEPAKA